MDGRAARGTGILDPGCRLEAESVVGLQHQRRRETLRREVLAEVAEIDLVDLLGAQSRIGNRLGRDLGDQGLDVFVLMLAKRRMAPADDAGGHAGSPHSHR